MNRNSSFRILIFSLMVTVFGPAALGQETHHVPSQFPTIQSAVDFSSNGDVVLVAPGTYYELIDFRSKKITVRSEEGPEATIVDGNNQGPVVLIQYVEGPGSVFEGFTVRNGWGDSGGAMYIGRSAPLIKGNIFEFNYHPTAGDGAAISGNVAAPRIEGNVFRNNSCGSYYTSSSVVGFKNGSFPVIVNNLFLNNDCRAIWIVLPETYYPIVANNTIVGNTAGIFFGYYYIPIDSNVYRNNIIFQNGVGVETNLYPGTPSPVWKNNLVYDNGEDYVGMQDPTGTDGNLSRDPSFIDELNGDFRLRSNSPAVDAGSGKGLILPPYDFAGNPRVLDGNRDGILTVDIGAHEFRPESIFTFIGSRMTVYTGNPGKDRVFASGSVVLSPDSNGIVPTEESLNLKLSSADQTLFEETIPAGSFLQDGKHAFRYESDANGIHSFYISQTQKPGIISFAFVVSGVNITGIKDNLAILTIKLGDERGTFASICSNRSGVFSCR